MEKLLQEIGLTSGEARIYLALLDLGESTTGPIIKKAKISGSKAYEILDKLIEKGLASHIIKDKTKYFQAAPPNKILSFLDEKEKVLTKQKQQIKDILPQLNKKQKPLDKSAQIYQGVEGLKSVYELILGLHEKGETYYVLGLGNELQNERVKLFLQKYHARRDAKGVFLKVISNFSNKELYEKFFGKNKQVKYTDINFPTGVVIFKEHIVLLDFEKEPVVFLIKSPTIFNSYQKFFDNLWEISKE